ncbi:PEP/pyruvate-binding domain-containing protein [Desulfitobacterium sp. PCE1]|uniref:PEP/pyruvate-binding domain-containing protein n=1 Tax=Desulfitobacterium sp. PCE1 TaxID=146907 RepID=UPI001FA7F096|nr:PEP/pyruvate-binding domain-containing protein [Desulfitobacterium sp. PCE1]
MMFIKEFGQIDINSIQEVGGKGANLGEMTQAGLPVPPGYCITAEAYRQFVSRAGLDELLAQLAEPSTMKNEDIALLSQEISQRILETPLPEEVAQEVVQAFTQVIGHGSLAAVRSSATAEDLPEASFAGQQESYLNIPLSELSNHIKLCWASLWTERAIHYRINNSFDQRQVFLAVVVQQMVDSEVSGVAFSVNPLNAKENEIVIESVWGLGEGIVSGKVTPDHYVINKQNDPIIRYIIADKEKMAVHPLNGPGTTFAEVAEDQRQRSSLSKKDILELTELIKRIEEHYQFPQDIEWAKTGNRYYILQARPITTLHKSTEQVDEHIGESEFFNFDPELEWTNLGGVKERYNKPSSVLGWSILEPCDTEGGLYAYRSISKKELPSPIFAANIYGYLYLNFTNLKSLQPLKMLEPYSSVPDWQQFAPKRTWFKELTLTIGSIKAGNKLINSLAKAFYAMLPDYLDNIDKHKKTDVKSLTMPELLDYIKNNLELAKQFFQLQLPSLSVTEALYNMLTGFMKKWLGDEDLSLSSKLVSGLPDNLTVRTNNKLWELTETVASSPYLRELLAQSTIPEFLSRLDDSIVGKAFKAKLTDFLGDYGHLNVNMDIAEDFWWENPGIILAMVKGSLTADKRINPEEREQQKQKEREETEVLVRSKLNFVQRAIFDKLLKSTQSYMLLRDNRHFYVTMPFSLIKKLWSPLRKDLQRKDICLIHRISTI